VNSNHGFHFTKTSDPDELNLEIPEGYTSARIGANLPALQRPRSLVAAGRSTVLGVATQSENSENGAALPVLTYTRNQAADALNISLKYLDTLTADGKIAVCKVGRRKLYRPQALADYLTQTERKTRAA